MNGEHTKPVESRTEDPMVWHPVEGHKPVDQQQVLLTREFDGERMVTEALWDEHHDAFFDPCVYGLMYDPGEGPYGEITGALAWMPMPEPYHG